MALLTLSRLYPITLSDNPLGLSLEDQVACFLEAGVSLFQVREKELSDEALLPRLLACRKLAEEAGARLIVNDRCALAGQAGASGVHLGQDDLPPESARRLLGPDAVIGVSTHTAEQFDRAQRLPVDYVAIGPIFPTATKKTGYEPLGLKLLERMNSRKQMPTVAIGGITLRRAAQAWAAGADSVAVLSDLFSSGDLTGRTRQYLELGHA